MKRREFLGTMAATGVAASSNLTFLMAADEHHADHDPAACHPTYATIQDAIASARETFAFVPAITVGTKSKHPDYMATVDVDPDSETYGTIVGRFAMPEVGDELHHYGWNACSSCHGEGASTLPDRSGPGVRQHLHCRCDRSKAAEFAQDHSRRGDRQEDESLDASHGSLPRRWHDHDLDAG